MSGIRLMKKRLRDMQNIIMSERDNEQMKNNIYRLLKAKGWAKMTLSFDDFKYAFPKSFFELVAERDLSDEQYWYAVHMMWCAYEDDCALTPWEALKDLEAFENDMRTLN
jgi:hypothetical protein